MQPNTFDDTVWDDLDDDDFENCIIKEYEILSQNPSLLRKPTKITTKSTYDEGEVLSSNSKSGFPIKASSSAFQNSQSSSINTGRYKSNGLSRASPNSKSRNFYKPLDIGPSRNAPIGENEKCLQTKIDHLLGEKSRLQEDNFVKIGEIENLRCEVKKWEMKYETQHVDHSLALDAAELRGKQKASKELNDKLTKIKELENEVDKLQGTLSFKNLEIDELMEKFKHINNHSASRSSKFATGLHSPSSKRRRTSFKVSTKKDSLGFENSFDLGACKAITRNASIQTESICKSDKRVRIAVTNGADHVYSSHLINSERTPDCEIQTCKFDTSKHSSTSKNSYLKSVIDQLNSAAESVDIASMHSKQLKNCEDNLLTRLKFSISVDPLLKAACNVADITSGDLVSSTIEAVLKCLRIYSVVPLDSERVKVCLSAFSNLVRYCTDIDNELCSEVCAALKSMCKTSPMETLDVLLPTVTALCSIGRFRQSICAKDTGDCLLARLSDVIISYKCPSLWTKQLRIALNVFVSSLLRVPDSLADLGCGQRSSCGCTFSLLETFVKNLHFQTQHISIDSDWHPIITGIGVLHLWMRNDEQAFWDRVSHSSSYLALLDHVITQSEYLKSRELLDHRKSEVLSELYMSQN